MEINELFADKSIKQKEKVEILSQNIIEKNIKINDLLKFPLV